MLLMLTGLLVGCSDDDPRLQGTWKSNREETVAAVFKDDPKWAAATSERKEEFSRFFGNMTITYSNQVATMVTPAIQMRSMTLPASTNTSRYKVVERGPNHVVLEVEEDEVAQQIAQELSLSSQGNIRRIEFVEDAKGYWTEMGFPMADKKEKFDRVSP